MRTGVILIIIGTLIFLANTPELLRSEANFLQTSEALSVEIQPPSEETNLEGVEKLILETFDGTIDLETSDRLSLSIERRGAVTQQIERNGTSLTIRAKSQGVFCNQCRVNFRVRLNKAIALELHNTGGNINVSGRSLALKARTVDGNISLKNAGHGRFDLQSTNGNIELENAAGNISLQSIDGNISATNLENTQLRINATGGTVSLKNIVFDDSQQIMQLVEAALKMQNTKNTRLKIEANSTPLQLENIDFVGISQIKSTDGKIEILNSKEAILQLEATGESVILENLAFSAGSSNVFRTVGANVILKNLVLPFGMRLTGQTQDGRFKNNLAQFVTRLTENSQFESILAGSNPVILEVDTIGSSLEVK